MRQKRAQKILNESFPSGDPRRWEPGANSLKRVGQNWHLRWEFSLAFKLEIYFEKMLTARFGPLKLAELLELQQRFNRLSAAINDPDFRRLSESDSVVLPWESK